MMRLIGNGLAAYERARLEMLLFGVTIAVEHATGDVWSGHIEPGGYDLATAYVDEAARFNGPTAAHRCTDPGAA